MASSLASSSDSAAPPPSTATILYSTINKDDTAIWLHNKLGSEKLWSSSSSVVSQYTLEKLQSIRDCFSSLESFVKFKFFLSLFHIPKRKIDEFKPLVNEIIENTLETCLDQWVLSIAMFVKTYWHTQSLDMDKQTVDEYSKTLDSFKEAHADLKLTLAKYANHSRCRFLLPLECDYMTDKASTYTYSSELSHLLVSFAEQQEQHFNLKKKPGTVTAIDELKFRAGHHTKKTSRVSTAATTVNSHNLNSFNAASSSSSSLTSSTDSSTAAANNGSSASSSSAYYKSKLFGGSGTLSRHLSQSTTSSPTTSSTTTASSFFKRSSLLGSSAASASATITGKATVKRDIGIKVIDADLQVATPKEAKRRRKEQEKEELRKQKEEQRKQQDEQRKQQLEKLEKEKEEKNALRIKQLMAAKLECEARAAAAAAAVPPKAQPPQETEEPMDYQQQPFLPPTTVHQYLQHQQQPQQPLADFYVKQQPVQPPLPPPPQLQQQQQQLPGLNLPSLNYYTPTATFQQQPPSITPVVRQQPVSAATIAAAPTSNPFSFAFQQQQQQQPIFIQQQQQQNSLQQQFQPQQQQPPPPPPPPQAQGQLTLTREQMHQVQELFSSSNRLTRPEKALILSFIAGNRENPRPEYGPIITLKLSEGEEMAPNGQGYKMLSEVFFQMNFDTGEYRKIKKLRPLLPPAAAGSNSGGGGDGPSQ